MVESGVLRRKPQTRIEDGISFLTPTLVASIPGRRRVPDVSGANRRNEGRLSLRDRTRESRLPSPPHAALYARERPKRARGSLGINSSCVEAPRLLENHSCPDGKEAGGPIFAHVQRGGGLKKKRRLLQDPDPPHPKVKTGPIGEFAIAEGQVIPRPAQ